MALLSLSMVNAQAYKGKNDIKGQVGWNIQDHGNGIQVSADFGIGENMSYGSVEKPGGIKPDFADRADVKARFNANLGNVFGFEKQMDIYPGLHLGTRNFGAHLGFRYFFTVGFGVFAEGSAPLARYDSNVEGFEKYNNQFVFVLGASFNL